MLAESDGVAAQEAARDNIYMYNGDREENGHAARASSRHERDAPAARPPLPPPPPLWLPYPRPPKDPRLRRVGDAVGLADEGDAEMLALLAPSVFETSPEDLSSSLAELRRLLPAPRGRPPPERAAAADPALLLAPRATVVARLSAAAAALRLPRRGLLGPRGAELRYYLATRPPEALLERVDLASELLGVGQEAARQLLLAAPGLFGRRAAEMRASAETIEQVCQCPLPKLAARLLQVPDPLAVPADRLFSAASSLQSDLQLSEEGLAVALRRAPAALAAPPGRVGRLAGVLVSRMAVGRDVAVDLLLQEPALLCCGPGALGSLMDCISGCFDLDPEQLLQVVEFDPSALLVSPGVLAARVRHFRALADSCAPWRREFRLLMSQPANVARALNLDAARLQRLSYLAGTGRQGSIPMRTALTLSRRQFKRAYPRFEEWRDRQRPAAAAAAAVARRRRQQPRGGVAGGSQGGGEGTAGWAGDAAAVGSSSSSWEDEGGGSAAESGADDEF